MCNGSEGVDGILRRERQRGEREKDLVPTFPDIQLSLYCIASWWYAHSTHELTFPLPTLCISAGREKKIRKSPMMALRGVSGGGGGLNH